MTQDLIGRIQRLLISPAKEWDVIDAEPADVEALYRNYIGPLVIFAALAHFIGTYFFSRDFAGLRPLFGSSVGHALLSIVLGLAMIYIFALIIDALGPSFGAARNFGQAFKVAAYAPTASWVGAVFALIPGLGILAALASLYSLYILFLGLPKLMKPGAERGLTYTIISVLCMVGLGIVIGTITATGMFY